MASWKHLIANSLIMCKKFLFTCLCCASKITISLLKSALGTDYCLVKQGALSQWKYKIEAAKRSPREHSSLKKLPLEKLVQTDCINVGLLWDCSHTTSCCVDTELGETYGAVSIVNTSCGEDSYSSISTLLQKPKALSVSSLGSVIDGRYKSGTRYV